MAKLITQLFLHPLFRLVFWTAVTGWLIVLGLSYGGWARWVNFIMAIIALGTMIEQAVKSVTYFSNAPNK